MTVVTLNLEPDIAGHLAVAVRRHRGSVEKLGGACPAELEQFEELVLGIARGSEWSGMVSRRDDADAGHRDREYLSPAEVVMVTGLSKSTISRRLRDGSLPSALVGRSRKVRRRDIAPFMEAQHEHSR